MSPEVNEPHVALTDISDAVSGESTNGPWIVTRRQVLGSGVAVSLGAVLIKYDPQLHNAAAIENVLIGDVVHNVIVVAPAQPALHFSVERPDDLLLLDITFYGFTLVKGATYPSLVATTAKTIYNWIGVIVQFPPQAIGEGNYIEINPTPPIPFDPTPVLSQVSGPSRLAFTFNHGDKIPLPHGDLADLLNWTGWRLNVPPTALTGTGLANPVKPKIYETAIECPLDMFLTPVVDGSTSAIKGYFSTKFTNRTAPFASPHQVVECWTTSLSSIYSIITSKGLYTQVLTPSVAAVWANDYPSNSANATDEEYIVYDPYHPIT